MSVWFFVVFCGDIEQIYIGCCFNVQDNVSIYIFYGFLMKIGKYVIIGYNVVVYGVIVDDYMIIGMGVIIFDGVKIGKYVIIGVGVFVLLGKEIFDYSFVVGVFGKVVRQFSEEEIEWMKKNVEIYMELVEKYFKRKKIE